MLLRAKHGASVELLQNIMIVQIFIYYYMLDTRKYNFNPRFFDTTLLRLHVFILRYYTKKRYQ